MHCLVFTATALYKLTPLKMADTYTVQLLHCEPMPDVNPESLNDPFPCTLKLGVGEHMLFGEPDHLWMTHQPTRQEVIEKGLPPNPIVAIVKFDGANREIITKEG